MTEDNKQLTKENGELQKWVKELLTVAECHIEECPKIKEENKKLKQWVSDLQSGMYINCVYCGHRYGHKEDTPASMANILKEHIENCPDHPMSKLKDACKKLIQYIRTKYDVPDGQQLDCEYMAEIEKLISDERTLD